MRLDQYLVAIGLVETRNKAQALIRTRQILVNETVIEKPGWTVKGNPTIRSRAVDKRFVSRGGDKLEAAVVAFNWNCKEMVIADFGASTGGFTDCVLQHGAKKVYAIDVGYGQLAWKLRQDSRVIVMERTNARHLESLPESIDAIVADLSFISVTKMLPAMKKVIKPGGEGIILIKPQFEAGPKAIKNGVFKNPEMRQVSVDKTLDALKSEGLEIIAHMASPVAGAKKGNIEELTHIRFP